ncbi:hypothetical protein JRO89_XS15G0169500 [Xanthoceras sorbifolium]|uniref:Wax synthase domain-containing protein n=1 Tax=Xanthoceras sorbifolium TaxID=99658 RepID=A0ABQ8H2N5_9ROSI|nr:hypothetical protein JRO89_XS15G0169500 [Xanthoceras sorbifolium]
MEGGGGGVSETEINNFFHVCVLVIASLSYCYYIASKIPSGLLRLLSLLPVVYLFILLPLRLSSAHLGGLSAFLLVWLANFKLLLFSVDQGPLSPPPPNLFHFISVACLPIKIKPPPSQVNHTAVKTSNHHKIQQVHESSFHVSKSALLALKIVLLGLIFYAYTYKQNLHESFILVLYCCHMYLQLELLLAISATPARALFGFELEPQFNEPYLATSLQDFWSRRWNLMVTGVLRPTVYSPVRRISMRVIGPQWASLLAVMAAFAMSGLMHEVMYYYLTRVPPTWEVFWFFVLQGGCLVVEVAVKRALGSKLRLHPAVSGPLVVGFVSVTSVWLFWPQLLRHGVDERVISEFFSTLNFIKEKVLNAILA